MVTTAEVTRNGIHQSHHQHSQQAVTQAAAVMDTPPYNDGKDKLQRAMCLVLEGEARAHTDGLYTVQGSTKTDE